MTRLGIVYVVDTIGNRMAVCTFFLLHIVHAIFGIGMNVYRSDGNTFKGNPTV